MLLLMLLLPNIVTHADAIPNIAATVPNIVNQPQWHQHQGENDFGPLRRAIAMVW